MINLYLARAQLALLLFRPMGEICGRFLISLREKMTV
jgi:hypothetical protein